MPNIKSKIKRVKTNLKARSENKPLLSAVRTAVKRARLGLTIKDPKCDELIKTVHQSLDKAVSKGIYHKNKANRIKSKLMRRMHKNNSMLKKDHVILKEIEKSETPVPEVEKTVKTKVEPAKEIAKTTKTTSKATSAKKSTTTTAKTKTTSAKK